MDCPECGAEAVGVAVPADLAGYLPDDRPAVAVCTRCLHVAPADDAPETPDFGAISDALPRDQESATALVLALAVLDSPALYRTELEAFVETVERAGVDPLLVLDRLAADPDLDPHLDLDRRRRQLEQLLR